MSGSIPKMSKWVGAALVGLSLAGCAGGIGGFGTTGSQTSDTGLQSSMSDVANAGAVVDETTQLVLSDPRKLTGYCPNVSILDDTNIYQTFTRGNENNAQEMIHQASITQTARECTTLGAEMFLKVGVAGRVLGGPKSGETSKVTLPLRIVVRQEDRVLYSHLYKVPVTLTPPDRSALFAKVEEAIAIPTPQDRNVQILVGFDSDS